MFKNYLLAICSILFIMSCSEEATPDNENEVTNLVLSINNVNDGSGLVEVTATAQNAINFTMDTGDIGSSVLSSSDGEFDYTYPSTGSYMIRVTAEGSGNNNTIAVEETINVNAGAPAVVGEGYSTPIEYFDMDLVWNDEFNGTELNSDFWSHDLGNGCPNLCGWGNQELEYYREENLSVGGGVLTMEAKRESFQGSSFTSSKILTRDKQSFHYGRIDIRAQFPETQGFWPALWLLGDSHATVGWPRSGEIDIVEMVGGAGRENVAIANAFWDNNSVANFEGRYELPEGTLAEEYHVFSIVWTEEFISWRVNDVPYHTLDITSAQLSAFQEPFYMIMNVAVGGTLPGDPDITSLFPQSMKVDYIRYFQPK